jgi:hypothetical protein
MRFVVAILGLLGAAGGAFLGMKWLSDLKSDLGEAAQAMAGLAGMGDQMAGLKNATYALLGCAALGLIVSILVAVRKGNKVVNAILLIVAGVLPLVFETRALFGTPMALAGLLAFAVKYEK